MFYRTLAEYKMKDESRRYALREIKPRGDIAGLRAARVGILMYGKKPSLPEILKWIRYS